jgi:hypothetical protein
MITLRVGEEIFNLEFMGKEELFNLIPDLRHFHQFPDPTTVNSC